LLRSPHYGINNTRTVSLGDPGAGGSARLPVLDYLQRPPKGFPADAEPASTAPLTQALRPTRKPAVYDAPGGKALAYAVPTISGVPLIMPIVGEEQGWRSVLLPSVNGPSVGCRPPVGRQSGCATRSSCT
jgi:hypothetical protein